jgi:hypothetical protein
MRSRNPSPASRVVTLAFRSIFPCVLAIVLLSGLAGCGGEQAEAPASGTPTERAVVTPPPDKTEAAAPAALSDADRAALSDPCSLLSVDEIRQATGRNDYIDRASGDELGEGMGGGASCEWFAGPGSTEKSPSIGVVVIPPREGKRWTAGFRAAPRKDCTYEAAPAAGDGAFFEVCPNAASLPLYVPARAVDIVVLIEVRPPATNDSVRPMLVDVARAVAAKLR